MSIARRIAVLGPANLNCRNFVNAVGLAGGSVGLNRQSALSNKLFGPLQDAGTWALMDDAWLLVAGNPIQSLMSIKQLRLATAVNSPTFTADQGYAFDGALNYIDTGWIAANHAVAMTISNVRMSVYDRVNVASNGYVVGVTNSGNRSLRVRPRVGSGAISLEPNATGGSFTPAVVDSRGYTSGSRNGPDVTSYFGYKNGVPMVQASAPTGFGTAIITSSMFIGGVNSTGAFVSGSPGTIGFLSVGAQLSAAQELAEYNVIQNYMTVWGAQV